MDFLWSPWRYRYVSGGDRRRKSDPGCVLCAIRDARGQDREALIVHRARRAFVVLNRYPYTSGHLMVVPYAHLGTLAEAPPETAAELMDLTRSAEAVLRDLYRPDGINIGMNIGSAAGAGVAGHIHMHALPRWVGDSSFATVVGETRVLPEDLSVTWERVRGRFAARRQGGGAARSV